MARYRRNGGRRITEQEFGDVGLLIRAAKDPTVESEDLRKALGAEEWMVISLRDRVKLWDSVMMNPAIELRHLEPFGFGAGGREMVLSYAKLLDNPSFWMWMMQGPGYFKPVQSNMSQAVKEIIRNGLSFAIMGDFSIFDRHHFGGSQLRSESLLLTQGYLDKFHPDKALPRANRDMLFIAKHFSRCDFLDKMAQMDVIPHELKDKGHVDFEHHCGEKH